MKNLILGFGVLVASKAAFAIESVTLKTSRGTEVSVTLHLPEGSDLPAVVVAPGQSCNSKGPLFETLGNSGANEEVAVVRFEWSYCNSKPAQPMPSDDLKNEIEDFETVLAYAKAHSAIDENKIVLAGKSLGSIVAYAVFAKEPNAKGALLLTPVCSQPHSVCEQNYPKLKEDSRPVLMALGNKDSLCLLPVLFDYLKDSKGNISTVVAGGDHGFRVRDAAGAMDPEKTQKNINSVVTASLNWLALSL